MGLLYKPHPWHGVSVGPLSPTMVTAYVECVPGEGIKYEVDKSTGYLKVDRPHKYSSLCPTIYGFRPIGGLRMIDAGEADDKIIAVIKGDPIMSSWDDVKDISKSYMDLIRHYFLTYKQSPNDVGGEKKQKVIIPQIYGKEQAYETIRNSQLD